MSITKLSYTLADYFRKQLNLDEDKTDILRYGFEVIVGESIKIITLFLSAYLLGILPYVLVSFVTAGSYRLFSGGYHSETYERCFIFSLIVFLGMGKIVHVLLPYFKLPIPVLFTIVITTFISTFRIAFKWAPAETANKPLSLAEKNRLKKFSLGWIILWFVLTSYILLWFSLETTAFIILGTITAHIIQTFSVTPTGFKVMRTVDTLADKLTNRIIRERREQSG